MAQCLQQEENRKGLKSVANLIQLGFVVHKSFSQVRTTVT